MYDNVFKQNTIFAILMMLRLKKRKMGTYTNPEAESAQDYVILEIMWLEKSVK